MKQQGTGAGKKRGPVKRGTKDMLTPAQVAERYGLSLQWAYHCIELKEIRKKVGKYVFYPLADLERVEKMDRDKATGAKTANLVDFRNHQDQKRRKELEAKLKMDFAPEKKQKN